jgi:hypothetical protein
MNRRIFYSSLVILAALFFFSTLAPALAQDTNWQSGYDDWFVSDNWDNGVPTDSVNAFINNGGYPYINDSGAVAQNLTLGSGSSDEGYLDINNGLTVGGGGGGGGGAMTVGDAGYAEAYLHYGGTLAVTGDLTLGAQSTGSGYFETYDTTTVGGKMVVGDAGTGSVYVGDGTLGVTGDLILGKQGSGSGSFTQDWGTTTVGGNMTVGDAGSGEAYLNGGTLAVTGDLTLGNQTGGYGYMENWDTLTVGGNMTIMAISIIMPAPSTSPATSPWATRGSAP